MGVDSSLSILYWGLSFTYAISGSQFQALHFDVRVVNNNTNISSKKIYVLL